MKRILLGLVTVFFVTSTMLALTSSDSKAHRRHHRYHHGPYYHKWAPPPPPGKSPWCEKYPKKCHIHGKYDPKVNTPWEACIDKKANGDGYLSKWEIERFGKTCTL